MPSKIFVQLQRQRFLARQARLSNMKTTGNNHPASPTESDNVANKSSDNWNQAKSANHFFPFILKITVHLFSLAFSVVPQTLHPFYISLFKFFLFAVLIGKRSLSSLVYLKKMTKISART